jgi:hypothetical protein
MLNIIAGVFSEPTPPVTNSYESIATVLVGSGGSTQIDFTSSPSTYKHLQLRAAAKGSINLFAPIRFNADTTLANYRSHQLYGNGVTATSSDEGNNFYINNVLGTNFNGVIMDILDYQNTNKNKTVRMLQGVDNNGSGSIMFVSGLWMNSGTAISSIRFTVNTGNFAQHSSFALYGIKG